MAPILHDLGSPGEVATVIGAIGNHEEKHGHPVKAVSAALILADKSDVHRTRVRNPDLATSTFTIGSTTRRCGRS